MKDMRKERETCEVPSGLRLMNLLREHLTEIMDRERANQNSIHLYCTGAYWVAFECSAYQLIVHFRIARPCRAPVRLPVPDRDGVRYGSLAPLVRPQTYLEKRRVGLQAIDRPRIFLGRLP